MSSAGHYTNHSLRSTSTTRLFNAHVDEQLIMMRTGHSSEKGVRAYKRTSEQLLEETSDVLNKKDKKEPQKQNVPVIPTIASVAIPPPPGDYSCTVDVDTMAAIDTVPNAVVTSSSQFGFNNIVSSSITFNVYK